VKQTCTDRLVFLVGACCTHSSLVNSAVAARKLTKFLPAAEEESLAFNLLKSKLRYSNPFWNVGVVGQFCRFGPIIGYHSDREKVVIVHLHSLCLLILKIW